MCRPHECSWCARRAWDWVKAREKQMAKVATWKGDRETSFAEAAASSIKPSTVRPSPR